MQKICLREFSALLSIVLALWFSLPVPVHSQHVVQNLPTEQSQERRTAARLEAVRSNPLELRAFLREMPKGADLHNHLSGAIYAESWVRAAAEEGLCVDTSKLAFTLPRSSPSGASIPPDCAVGQIPAADAYTDQHLYDALVDTFSMRGFVASAGITAHDHFFDAFARFLPAYPHHLGEWFDEVATRAAAQNEQYLELMHTPEFGHAVSLAKEIGWREDLPAFRGALLAKNITSEVAVAKQELDRAEEVRRQREHCGQANEAEACRVQLRYLCQVLRGFPKEQVFAQTLLCFETAAADRRYVGINLVMPEDAYIPRTDYAVQMRMVGFFHEVYPKIHISLHAGELAPGVVPYEDLCCHIRQAVEQGRAERIGHGVTVMYESRPYELLKEMVAKHVMVEINLTSNDLILGVAGKDHPLPLYRKFGVPVALSSDDEGVSRTDLTHEYVRAVQTYGLRYPELKLMVRTGLEHSFLPGASLWGSLDTFTETVAACSHDRLGTAWPSTGCANFLQSDEKARQQWELERRFREFEGKF